MLKIIFNPLDGIYLPDGKVEEWCLDLCRTHAECDDSTQHEVYVGQDIILMGIRVMVLRGIIPFDKVLFSWKEGDDVKVVKIDKFGRLEDHPSYWLMDDFLSELL